MATYKRFEDLPLWQQARSQCQTLYPVLQSEALAQDRALQGQMNRSSASVMDNIAEGFDRFSRADFRHFLIMARGSNAELRSQLYRCADRGYLPEAALQAHLQYSNHLGAGLTRFIHYLDKSLFVHKPKGPTAYVSEPGLPEAQDFYPEAEEDPTI